MTIKDCYIRFIELLEIECDVFDAIRYFNLVEYELALNYVPLTTEEIWKHYPKVYYKEFKYPIAKIIECENTKTKICKEYLITKDKKPLGKVRYQYLPIAKTSLDDVSEYSNICLECIVYGMLSEYFLSYGEYEIASMWSHRYKQEISHLQGCYVTCEPPKMESNLQKPFSLYEIIDEEPIQIINHETTEVRKCGEGAFVDLLNQEMRELTSSFISKTLLPTIEKELENAKTQLNIYTSLRAKVDNDNNVDEAIKRFYSKQEVWWGGQLLAYQNIINIIKSNVHKE